MKPSPAIVLGSMQGLRKVMERSSLMTIGALWLGLSQCGGAEFSAGSGGAAGSSNAGSASSQGGSGGSASGGAGGSAASGAASGASGAGGRGGSGTASCECPAGSYCLEGSTDCLSCKDLSRLSFDEPVRLATVSDSGAGSRFPRVGATSTDLIYRFDGVGMRYTADSSTSAGTEVASTQAGDSAPLLLRQPVALPVGALTQADFWFDRTIMDLPVLHVGTWNDGLQRAEPAPPPFNGGAGDFSVAVAASAGPGSGRAFWMTNRESEVEPARKPRLVTALLALDASAVDVDLKLSVGANQACPPLDVSQTPAGEEPVDPDLTPWVTSDGTLLVFSTTRLESGCAPGDQKRDIYTALLQASSGQPPAPALPMKDVNSPADDVDPSFSADLCDLYFSSNRDGKFAVYRAHRR